MDNPILNVYLLVEHRFGFGYALNFGNSKAVATFAAWAIMSST